MVRLLLDIRKMKALSSIKIPCFALEVRIRTLSLPECNINGAVISIYFWIVYQPILFVVLLAVPANNFPPLVAINLEMR